MGRKGGKEKIAKVHIYRDLAKVLSREKESRFSSVYHVMEAALGSFEILRQISNDPSIVGIVPRMAVMADLVKYCEQYLLEFKDYQLTPREAEEAVKYWTLSAKTVPMPRSFLWPFEEGLAFTRLPWIPKEGACPTWEEMLGRMTNSDAFMAWIGSLFNPLSYLQQYLWVRGTGQDGKGCINRFLARIFGSAYCAKQPRERGDKFWNHELIGKRLVVFPDCNDQTFVTSGFFKSLTGGDPISVEAKGSMAYSVRLNAKFMILSNERPEISSEVADRRRIIYCELSSRETEFDRSYEERLWAEGGAFLGRCLALYERLVPSHQPIPVLVTEVDDVIETSEMDFAESFDFYFDINREDRKTWLAPIEVQRRLNLISKYRKKQIEFLSFLERTYEIRKICCRNENGDIIKKYRYLTGKPIPLGVVRK